MAADAISVIEAAYDTKSSDEDWLAEVSRRCQECLGEPGVPVFGAIYQSHPQGFDYVSRQLIPHRDDWLLSVDKIDALQPRRVQASKFRVTTCETAIGLARRWGAPAALAAALFSRTFPKDVTIRDVVQLVGCDPNGRAVGITLARTKEAILDKETRETWTRVSTHLSHGYRLRQALSTLPGDLSSRADAILDSSGKVLHLAESLDKPAIKEDLSTAVTAIARARSSHSSANANEAVSLWRGLVRGTWSIIETFDTDHKALTLAVRNDPEVTPERALTRREAQVVELAAMGLTDDLICYSLGLSRATTQVYLARAIKKLGVRSRVGLIRAIQTLLRHDADASLSDADDVSVGP